MEWTFLPEAVVNLIGKIWFVIAKHVFSLLGSLNLLHCTVILRCEFKCEPQIFKIKFAGWLERRVFILVDNSNWKYSLLSEAGNYTWFAVAVKEHLGVW